MNANRQCTLNLYTADATAKGINFLFSPHFSVLVSLLVCLFIYLFIYLLFVDILQ